jgi:hypothetical protein
MRGALIGPLCLAVLAGLRNFADMKGVPASLTLVLKAHGGVFFSSKK